MAGIMLLYCQRLQGDVVFNVKIIITAQVCIYCPSTFIYLQALASLILSEERAADLNIGAKPNRLSLMCIWL